MSTVTRLPGSAGWMAPLGLTGVQLSAIVAGGGPLAGIPGVYGHEVSRDEAVATVVEILHSPIRGFDTANEYGAGESERRIGAALSLVGGPLEDVVVMTKADPAGDDYSRRRVRASVRESQERLGLDHLPVVHLHDPERFWFHDIAGRGGALEALLDLRSDGVIGAVGLAGGPVDEMSRYLDLGVFDVLLVHNRWTLVDRTADRLIDQAAGAGLGVVNAGIFGGGILANPAHGGTYGYRPVRAATAAAVHGMREVCRRHGTDLRTAALQFSLRDPRVTATVVGMSRPARVQQTLDSARTDVDDDLWGELDALLPPKDAWLDAV